MGGKQWIESPFPSSNIEWVSELESRNPIFFANCKDNLCANSQESLVKRLFKLRIYGCVKPDKSRYLLQEACRLRSVNKKKTG